jgi:hypothetical protein
LAFTPLLFPALQSRSRNRGSNQTKKQFQKEQKYDYKHKKNSATHFQRTGCHEINASCDWQRFVAQSIKAAKRSPIPDSDRGISLRDLARARTGAGP